MITVTENGKRAVLEVLRQRHLPASTAVRLAIVRDGRERIDTEFRYLLDVESQPPKPTDHIFHSKGVTVFVDAAMFTHVDGVHIDVLEQKFTFKNQRTHSATNAIS
jgi:Fe-S cluster assembly iron-binding protein IscA